jgi:parallel beta-helix repeat protein
MVLAAALMLIPAGAASAANSPVHTVWPGQSIQDALERAEPGETVLVRPGTYRENLEMVKDGVTLLGYGATLAPPDTPTPRRCSIAVEAPVNRNGVCIAGELVTVPGEAPTLGRPVHNVTIRGLTVAQFPRTGIVVFNAVGTRIEHTDVAGGASYGMLLALHTSRSVIAANRVHGGVSAGIYIGDSPDARATVVGNEVFDSGVYGIFLRDASYGTVAGNVVRGNCIGVGLLPTRPERAAVTGWRVTANRIHDNNSACALGAPPGSGVLIAGASDITVTYNVITDNGPLDPAATRGGGVLLYASEFGGPAEPADNRIQANVLRGNRLFDLAVLAGGTGNQVSRNACQTSTPEGLCPN